MHRTSHERPRERQVTTEVGPGWYGCVRYPRQQYARPILIYAPTHPPLPSLTSYTCEHALWQREQPAKQYHTCAIQTRAHLATSRVVVLLPLQGPIC